LIFPKNLQDGYAPAPEKREAMEQPQDQGRRRVLRHQAFGKEIGDSVDELFPQEKV
jgi:hypothetical protein